MELSTATATLMMRLPPIMMKTMMMIANNHFKYHTNHHWVRHSLLFLRMKNQKNKCWVIRFSRLLGFVWLSHAGYVTIFGGFENEKKTHLKLTYLEFC